MQQIIKNWLDNNILVYWDRLLKRPNVVNGLIEKTEKQIAKSTDYVHGELGAVYQNQKKADGDFTGFLPVGEQQNDGFERFWCVSEDGLCNQIETDFNYFVWLVNNNAADKTTKELVKIFKYFGLIKNDKCLLDTAYVASGSGTTRRGNSYNRVANFVRHYGLIPKGTYPAYNTWDELYFPTNGTWVNGNKLPQSLIDMGKKLAEYIDITYKWVKTRDMDATMQDGSQGTSLYAWASTQDGIYQPVNQPANHAVLKFKKTEPKWKMIFDSYDPFLKKLSLNYPLGSGMQLSFGIKKPLPNERDLLLQEGREYAMRTEISRGGHGEIYEITKDKLIYISPAEWNNRAVKEKTIERKIKFITEDYYAKLMN